MQYQPSGKWVGKAREGRNGRKGDQIADTSGSSQEGLGATGIQKGKASVEAAVCTDVEKYSDGESNVLIICML